MTHQKTSSKDNLAEALEAPGRLSQQEPIAVIDIGSNSVRQVIYEGLTRAPYILFNEKVLCGLGRGIAETGKLDDEAVARALAALQRFGALREQAGVTKVYVLATAAAREADNGAGFIDEVERITGEKVVLLTGVMEAEYAAWGVECGFHDPVGVVGDMGGGSLELVQLDNGLEDQLTLPLGGLRLEDLSGGSISKARKIAKKHLGEIPKRYREKTGTFYAVGGTWRSLAKLHMVHKKYPLSVLHDYTIKAKDLIEFCDVIANDDLSKLEGIGSISGNRQQLLPYGAVVMAETLKAINAKQVKISAFGVREGYLYTLLDNKEKAKDPLLEAAQTLNVLRARSPGHAEEMAEWTGRAFEVLGISETDDEERYRKASCFMADIAWRAHSDFRAEQSLGIISNAVFAGISHEGRAYMALANYRRHVGLSAKTPPPEIVSLCGDRVRKRARILAGMFRVLYLFSASIKGIVPQLGFEKKKDDSYVLTVPAHLANLVGERPRHRLNQLAKEADAEMSIAVLEN